MINGLDLFSGIGGLSLALSPWVQTIAYCERDQYCQSVLLSRMRLGELSTGPIWDDITTLLPSMLPRKEIDIIFGGFPCQDISSAGTRIGLEGKRSSLFYEVVRLAEEIKPQFIFLENVPAIRTRGAARVGKELAYLRYDCRWGTISAKALGAPHKRDRWFLLANADSKGRGLQPRRREWPSREETSFTFDNGQKELMADSNGEGLERLRRKKSKQRMFASSRWWTVEPSVDRVANGIPRRVDRIRGLGNAVVPVQAKAAFEKLMGIK